MADRIVELPGQPQVFALMNSRQMLRKLEWELNELRTDLGYPSGHQLAYRAINCAVTTWQLVDWVWADMTNEQRCDFGTSDEFEPKHLAKHCIEANSDLKICESIANSSKHRKRRARLYNPAIGCKMFAEVDPFTCGDAVRRPLSSWKWQAVILYHGEEHRALDVFDRAYAFWRAFIDERCLPPE